MCAVPELEEIEVVAADNLGGTTEGSQFHASNVRDTLWQQSALDNLGKLQFSFQPSAFFIGVVVQTDHRRIVHFQQACIHMPLTDNTNAKRIVLDFLEAAFDQIQMG